MDLGTDVSDLAAKLGKLNQALRHFGPAESREVLLESVLNVAERVFGLDAAALLLLEPDGRLRVAASRGYRPEVVQAYHASLGEGVAGKAALDGQPRLVQDVQMEEGYIPGVESARSEMAVPLMADERVLGVLDLESRKEAFQEGDVALLCTFAEHVAWALRHQEILAHSRERARRMELLNRATRALTAVHDPKELIQRILETCDEALGFRSVAFLEAEEDGRHLVVRAALRREGILGLRIPADHGIAASAFTSGKAERVGNTAADPRYLPGGLAGAGSEMAAPLRLNGQVVGVLDAEAEGLDAFSEFDLEVFSMFAAEMAVALLGARQVREIAKQAARFEAIAKAGRALNTILDLDELIETILSVSRQALNLERVALLLLDARAGELVVRSALGYGEIMGKRIPLGQGVTGTVALLDRPELVRDVKAHHHYLAGVEGGCTEMAVPLRVYGELVGVLDAESPVHGAFDEQDLAIFSAFGDQAAVALYNAQLIRRLEESNRSLVSTVKEMEHMNRELEAYSAQIREANQSLEQQIHQLHTLHQAGQTITSSLDLNQTLDTILRMAGGIVSSSATAIKLVDEETKELRVKAQTGIIEAGGGPCYKLDLPLRIGEKTIGVFELLKQTGQEMSVNEHRLLETLASQAAIAIENARLFEDTQRAYYDTLKTLAMALEARDDYTRGHSERVAELSLITAQTLQLPDEECRVIFNSALLHDIGKIGVRDSVLLKVETLTDEDFEAIRQHPDHSRTILSPLKFLGRVSEYVKHHHERWDGRGYPEGLQGAAIPLPSRIIAVADTYDAMTSSRPYRASRTHETAMAEIERQAGRQFDPAVVEAFVKAMAVGRAE